MTKRKDQRGKNSKPRICKNRGKQKIACIRTKTTNQSLQQTNSNASEDTCGANSAKLTITSNTKNITKYDDDIDHSKMVHLKSCRDHMKTWFNSFRKRKFVLTDRKDFEALLGKGKLYADHMPASDLKLRNVMGKLLIHELHDLYIRGEADPSLKFWWITFVGDRYMFNERAGTAEVFKLKTAVQAALGKYTLLNAIGVIENQAIVNFPEDREGKALSVHAHVLCWGTKDDVSMLKKHAKGFKSSITRLPIHSVRVHQVEGSFGRLARYMAKPPYEGKEVNFGKLKK